MSGKYATETLRPDEGGITRAAQILRDGGLVAVPTETVYGLAARADSNEAVARIYEVKGRPSFNPLIVHVASLDQARTFGVFSTTSKRLAEKYWPGPLTLVVPRQTNSMLASAVTAGLETIALRVPAHSAMRALLHQIDFPLAAPSANRSGFISPTTSTHVFASLGGGIDAVIDAGACEAGVESTILAVRDDGTINVLRPGPLDFGNAATSTKVEAPGQLASHYAPGKPVRLNAQEVAQDEFWVGFDYISGDCCLSSLGDLTEAASRLYDCLHKAARSDKPRIAVAPIPDTGLGVAINDRLRRAATPPD